MAKPASAARSSTTSPIGTSCCSTTAATGGPSRRFRPTPCCLRNPRRDEFETCRFEVRQVPGRQASAVEARNGRDHSVGHGHGSALSEGCTHDVAVGERGGFREGEDPVGKTVAPRGQALLQARGPLVGENFPDAEGEFGNCHRRRCQLCIVAHEPGDYSGVWRLAQRLLDDVGIEEDQSSGLGLIFRFSRMTTSRSKSLP